jgi:hypothetical protein
MSYLPSAQAFTGDGEETERVPALFAVESHVEETIGWVLECRHDERGYGTPLLWYSAGEAEFWIKERCEESGCYGDQRVVGFGLSFRGDPPRRCDCCGMWGHDEADCTSEQDPGHTCVNGPGEVS